MKLKIVTWRDGSGTTYRVTGSLENVLEEINNLCLKYHPHGYGTRLESMRMNDDGNYTAQMWRANSCD